MAPTSCIASPGLGHTTMGPLLQQPRVYSPEHIEQLARINQVARTLRDIDIKVLESHLSLTGEGTRPFVRIAAPNPALLALGKGLMHVRRPEGQMSALLLDGVDVRWACGREAA